MSYFQDYSYDHPPAEESLFAKVLRESDERFYATFPDARAAAEQQGRLRSYKPSYDYGVPLYYNPQPYQTSGQSSGATLTQGSTLNPPSLPTASSSSLEDALHYTYLTPNEVSGFSTQSDTTSQSQLSIYSNVQQNLVQQQQATQMTFNDVPALAWATQPTISQGGLTSSPTSFTPLYAHQPAASSASFPHSTFLMPTNYSSASYQDANTPLVAPASNYHDPVYQQSLSMGPSSAELHQQREAPTHVPQPVHRHTPSRDRRSQSYPYPNPRAHVKSEEVNHGLPAPIASPARPAHVPGHVGHSRRSSHSHSHGSSLTRSTTPRRPTYSPTRASPSRSSQSQQSASSSSRSAIPLSPLPSKRQLEKKPPLACLFCRGRKIACGAPEPGSTDKTCNQCQRRSLTCEYPAESRRGMRKKKNTAESAEVANEKSTSRPATPPNFPGEGTLEP